ncbi:TetR/AcrR family transcriptional regulator [Nocardioides marinus]|jgi:AcrR family transcriptional regulator|nr:TetR/AcrR family transcriptional regulator [Nocardioides marinus]MBU2076023.1 TetR/AcrR family transcriptional regulator [Actinomycetota bacterium]
MVARQAVDGRRAETLEKLLEAGSEELRAVGHDALTVRSVAARAGVSPATAYTYVASKNHLFAELFWRYLDSDRPAVSGSGALERLRATTRALAGQLAAAPELAAAVTPALLSSDPDVERLRLRIGGEFLDRFAESIGDDIPADRVDPVLETLVMAFSGALLQTGMGLITYAELADRLDPVVGTILEGHL